MDQERRVVLITGTSSNIGKACAEYLASRGFRVYGTSRKAKGQETIVTCDTASYSLIQMDVNDEDSVKRGIGRILEREGTLDVVVNNAGCSLSGAVENCSMAQIKSVFETNFFGVVRVCQEALPIMREQGSGHIVNVSSLGGRIAQPFQAFYAATKFAVEGFTESLRMEVVPFGIHVSLIEPGDISGSSATYREYAGATASCDAYEETFRTCMRVMEADEANGSRAEIVGPALYRIITNRSPRLRHPVGAVFQKSVAVLKGLLPSRLFEWGLRKYYRVP